MDVSSVVHLLTDKTRSFSSKAIFVVVAFLVIIFLDNTFSFSYYYNTSQKVSHIKSIGEGLNDPTLSNLEKQKLIQLRNEILNHRTFKDVAYNYLTNLNFESQVEETNKLKTASEFRDPKIHFLTSSWWIVLSLVILGITLPFVLLLERKDVFNTTLGFIVVCGVGYLVALVLSKTMSFIPLINGNPINNYVLNSVLSGILFFIFIMIGRRQKDKAAPTAA